MKIKQLLKRKFISILLVTCMVGQFAAGTIVQADDTEETLYSTRIDAADIVSGNDYVLTGSNISCSDHAGTGEYAISGLGNGNGTPNLLEHVPYGSSADLTEDIVWKIENYGKGYSLQSKVESTVGQKKQAIAIAKFNTLNTKSEYSLTDIADSGLQVQGKGWTYAEHTLYKQISAADIETVTIRFKKVDTSADVALMQFYNSANQNIYLDLAAATEDKDYVLSRTVDGEGFTVVTIDFQAYGGDPGDTWTNHAEGSLAKIGLGANGGNGKHIFDYVAFYDKSYANVEFSTHNTKSSEGHTLKDIAGSGLQVKGPAWKYATHTLEEQIPAADIETVTVRFKNANADSFSATMRFYNSANQHIYLNVTAAAEDKDYVLSRTVDGEGFTVVTIDFQKYVGASDDSWKDHAEGSLAKIGLGTSNNNAQQIFDYVAFNVDISQVKFSTYNTETSVGHELINTESGLHVRGKDWEYARHTLYKEIPGAAIDSITIRFKKVDNKGGATIMRFYHSDDEHVYLNASGATIDKDYVLDRTEDEEGFTILTIDLHKLGTNSSDTWAVKNLAAKPLKEIGIGGSQGNERHIFDYVAFNTVENNYMNIVVRNNEPQLELGTPQALDLAFNADGTLNISSEISGTKYSVNFTEDNGIGWQASSGVETNLNVYMISNEVPDVEEEREEPLYTIAAFTDMHIDYGIEELEDVIRPKTQEALDLIKEKENPDMVLVGGDTLSGNAGGSALADKAWEQETYNKVKRQVQEAFKAVSKDGKVLYVNGNHDYEPGYINYNSGAYIDEIMKADTGAYTDVLYEGADRMNNLLAYYYDMDSIHYIGLNTMYDGDSKVGPIYSQEVADWLDAKLQTIDTEEPVIVLGHYPFRDSKGMTKDYGMSEDTHNMMKEVLLKYPNVLYLYGHDHGSSTAYIQADTFERVTAYNADGSYATIRTDVTDSFTSCFMGSLSFYKNDYNTGWLSAEQPKVVQALMIYVYEDRIDLQMKNYGEETGTRQNLFSYSISREYEITSDVYSVNQEEGYVTDIAHQTTIEEFLKGFDRVGELALYGADDVQITDTSRIVRSYMTLKRIKNGKCVDELEIHVNLAAVSDLPYMVQNIEVEEDVITSISVLANTDSPQKAVGFVGLYDTNGKMLDCAWTDVSGTGTYELSLSLTDLPEGGTYRAIVYDSMTSFTPQSYLLTSDDERYATEMIATSVATEMIAGVDQKNNKITVYSQNSDTWDESAIVWEWSPSIEKGFRNVTLFDVGSDAKLRYSDFYGGYVVITCSSDGFVGIIDYETGECLWENNGNYGEQKNPHSVELLPDGNIAVADSAPSHVTVYASSQGDFEGYYARYTLEDAHGVAWDSERDILWAIGGSTLLAYTVTGTVAQPEFTVDRTYTTPSTGAHDLFSVSGDSDLLWLTTSTEVVQFSKSQGAFVEYDAKEYISASAVKSIGNQPYSGTIIRLIPDGEFKQWTGATIEWYTPDDNNNYTHYTREVDGALYKARVWYYKY